MTEDEAKAKWCPFARDSETAGNRSFHLPADIRFPCIASDCMAWRATDSEAGPMDPSRDRPPVWKSAGYCGLAGAQP